MILRVVSGRCPLPIHGFKYANFSKWETGISLRNWKKCRVWDAEGEGVPPCQLSKGSGARHKLPRWGEGCSPGRPHVLAHFKLERIIWWQEMCYFWQLCKSGMTGIHLSGRILPTARRLSCLQLSWMKTVHNNLNSHRLSWTEAVDLTQNWPRPRTDHSGGCCSAT